MRRPAPREAAVSTSANAAPNQSAPGVAAQPRSSTGTGASSPATARSITALSRQALVPETNAEVGVRSGGFPRRKERSRISPRVAVGEEHQRLRHGRHVEAR